MTLALSFFRGHWFSRHENVPDLTALEIDAINAALGEAPKRWDGKPDMERLVESFACNITHGM